MKKSNQQPTSHCPELLLFFHLEDLAADNLQKMETPYMSVTCLHNEVHLININQTGSLITNSLYLLILYCF